MTSRYSIADATLADLRAIAPRLREGDLAEIRASGRAPRHVLHTLWRQSVIRRSARIDGEIGAVWGCLGGLASPRGHAWLLTAPPVERVPLAFMREARREIDAMLATRTEIISGVLATYGRAVRFLKLLGFAVGEPEPFGPHGAPFCQISIQRAA